MAKRYVVVLERAENNWGAYSPHVPGCIATAPTREEAIEQFRSALEFHLEGLREDGLPEPEGLEPEAEVATVAVEVAPWAELGSFARASASVSVTATRSFAVFDLAEVA